MYTLEYWHIHTCSHPWFLFLSTPCVQCVSKSCRFCLQNEFRIWQLLTTCTLLRFPKVCHRGLLLVLLLVQLAHRRLPLQVSQSDFVFLFSMFCTQPGSETQNTKINSHMLRRPRQPGAPAKVIYWHTGYIMSLLCSKFSSGFLFQSVKAKSLGSLVPWVPIYCPPHSLISGNAVLHCVSGTRQV